LQYFAGRIIDMSTSNDTKVVALHVGCALSNLMQPNRSRYCSDLLGRCERSIAPMARAAKEEGVSFSHRVRFGGTESAIRNVGADLGRVGCVLVDQQAESDPGLT